MKKILFIITKSEWGGAQRFLFELAKSLDRTPYDITVASGETGELLDKLNKEGIRTLTLKHLDNSFGFHNLLAIFEIFFLVRKTNPNILYLNSSTAGFWGSIGGRLAGAPKIIYRIGGWAFKEPRNKLTKLFFLWGEKISAQFKDIIIVNSEFDRQLGIKNKIAETEKIITIYNGLNLDKLNFLQKDEALIKLMGISNLLFPPSHPLLVTIANLYKNKGLEYLIKAIVILKRSTGLKSARLIIIGEGVERKNLEKLIRDYRLENSIFLAGEIPDAYKYLKAFDLFVLPSVKEGQPWAVLEAMAAGVPIIATNIAGVPEMIETEKSGLLVEPGDAALLAHAIERMMIHPSLAQDCIKNAENRVKTKFSAEEMVSQNLALF